LKPNTNNYEQKTNSCREISIQAEENESHYRCSYQPTMCLVVLEKFINVEMAGNLKK
jgi:hypothetical protein